MLCCQFLFHVLKAIFFITIALKLSYFCKKMQTFRALEAPPPDPRTSGGWGLCPQTPSLWRLGASPPDPHWAPGAPPSDPKLAPPLRISGYSPGYFSIILMFWGIIVQVWWCSYVFTVTYLLLLFFTHLFFCNCKGSYCKLFWRSFPVWEAKRPTNK